MRKLATIRSYSDLEKALKQVVQEVMEKEVAEKAKEVIQDNVKEIVYNAGTPAMYIRRGLTNGSLGDIEEMKHEYKNGILEVSNESDYNHTFESNHFGYGNVDLSEPLAYNIEYGYGSKSEWYNQPRPFIEESREDMRNGEFKAAMRKGLRRKGIDTK